MGCSDFTRFLVIGFIVAAIILMVWASETSILIPVRQGFTAAGPSGFFYSEPGFKGAKTTASNHTVLYDGAWRIGSSDVPKDRVFLVTADGLSNRLFLHSPGKLNNLPAALGGLPAHDNYQAIFNSGSTVYIDILDSSTAARVAGSLFNSCIETVRDKTYCESEYNSI